MTMWQIRNEEITEEQAAQMLSVPVAAMKAMDDLGAGPGRCGKWPGGRVHYLSLDVEHMVRTVKFFDSMRTQNVTQDASGNYK